MLIKLNKKGYLTVESAMVIPIILCVIMVLTVLQYKVSNGGAISVIDDRKALNEVLKSPPKVDLFYKVHLANGAGELLDGLKKDGANEQKQK